MDAEAFEDATIAARRVKVPSAYEAAMELLDLASLHEEREEYERRIEVLRRVFSEVPAREETHADLMRLHALCGRRQEVVVQYERLSPESPAPRPGASTKRLGP